MKAIYWDEASQGMEYDEREIPPELQQKRKNIAHIQNAAEGQKSS
jgi:elongation factor G